MRYLLPLLTLLGTAFCGPLALDVTRETRDDRADRYVLPSTTTPTSYDVQLFLDPGNPAYFTGEVSIRILPQAETDEIVIHAMEMQIVSSDIRIFSDIDPTENLYLSHSLALDDTHLLRIRLTKQLTVMQPVNLNIKYTAQYAPNMFGVYVSTYQEGGNTVSLVTSQLQPTFARRAFPCYDEPHLKAIFRTTIYAPPQYDTVRSNMPLRDVPLKQDIVGWTKHEFADTPEMSTYLIAYLVSNFRSIEQTVNPLYRVPLRIYSRPNTQNTAQFALDFGQRNMAALEDYTDFEYILPKMDKAAVPDFAAGAMENWGLVIYREVALLVTEGVTTTSTRQNIGRIICHENVHQWFGNEVSPRSWTYTWLNEGFANFFENFATDFVLPEWRMMDQFVIALQNVFQSDAVLSVNPMTHPVYTPSEILGTFNAVAYQKSGSVIRMMQHFLTPEVFRQGLSYYIKDKTRDAAVPLDLYINLWRALMESNHTIPYILPTIMNGWANQGGFPVLTISRSAPTAQSVVVQQERFLTDRSLRSEDRWYVPINWVLSTNPDFSDTKPDGWVLPTAIAQSYNIPGLSAAEWFIFNKQQTGYYRVNYDAQNWAALVKVLAENHGIIHYINRGMLLDDSFNLARNGRLNYSYPLDLSLYLVDEKDYIPWASVNPAYTYLDMVLSESNAYPWFQRYIRNLTEPLYGSLGFEVNAGEEFVGAYHRNIILDLNCRHGNDHCISTAANLLDEFRNNPSQRLNPDIQGLVYCSGLRGGNVENFNFLWNMYLNTADSSEQSILLNALGCTSNAERRSFYLNQVISDSSQVREQDRHTILVSVTNASPDNMNAALDFVVENFHLIQPRVQGLTGTTNILNAFARRLTSQTHSDKVDELYSRHQGIFTAGELASIAGIRENIAASITWSTEYAHVVEEWLAEHYGDPAADGDDNDNDNGDDNDDDNGNGSATSLTTSLIVMISVIMTIFNN